MKIIFANLRLLPHGLSGDNCLRASLWTEVLTAGKPDVVAACEAWDEEAVSLIKEDMTKNGFVCNKHCLASGLILFGKTENPNVHSVLFPGRGVGADFFVRKGFLHARVGDNLILIVTHLQNQNSQFRKAQRKAAHTAQKNQISEFIRQIPREVLLVGTMNLLGDTVMGKIPEMVSNGTDCVVYYGSSRRILCTEHNCEPYFGYNFRDFSCLFLRREYFLELSDHKKITEIHIGAEKNFDRSEPE
jgi:hypothetical protein